MTITRNGLHDWWFEVNTFRFHYPSEDEAKKALAQMTAK